MNNEKQEFLERKERVMCSLTQAIDFLRDNSFEKEASVLEAQYENLKNEEFVITIVGEFSSGKSYLLNALMGDKLLPSYSGEATAAINFLRHTKKSLSGKAGCVYYKDGTIEEFDNADEETITRYACTRAGDDVTTDIDHIDIFLESRFLEDNVTLVDTPGLNGIKSGLADLTRQQIERSSASIFMFNARRPGSKTDFDALSMLRKKVDSIFLVLNAVDLVDESNGESVESIIQTLEDEYRKDFPDDKKLTKFHPVSAKMALVGRSPKKIEFVGRTDFTAEEKERYIKESGMPEFEDYLFKYLTKGPKGRQILLAPAVQLNEQLECVGDALENEQRILSGSTDVARLDEICSELEKTVQSLEERMEKDKNRISSEIKDIEKTFKEELEAESGYFSNHYIDKINNFIDIDEIMPDNICKAISKSLNNIVSDAFKNYSRQFEEMIIDYNKEINDELADMINMEDFKLPQLKQIELTSFESGVEEYERQLALMREESNKLESEMEKAEEQSIQARKLAQDRRRIERKIESYEEEMRSYKKEAMLSMPNLVKKTESYVERVDRDGVFGKIADFVVGRQAVTMTRDIIDSTARDAYKKQMDENLSDYNREISSLQSQADRYRGTDPELAEKIERDLQRKFKEKRQAELEYQKEFAEKIKETCARQLRVQKEEVIEYIHETVREIVKEAENYFKAGRKARTDVVITLLTRSLKKQIDEKCEEIKTLKKQAVMQENEREERIAQIGTLTKTLGGLRIQALDLKDELEAIEEYIIE